MVAEYLNLDELRSIGDLSNYRDSLVADVKSWEDEYKGLPLPDEIRPSYQRHNETIDAIDTRVEEFRARDRRLQRLADSPANQERTDDPYMSRINEGHKISVFGPM